MNYGNIKPYSIENGVGVRVSLFVSGCRNHCRGCFSAQTWDFGFGEPFTKEVEDHILELLRDDFENGLTVLGGEPMEPENQEALVPFLRRVREELPKKDIWMYTGFVLRRSRTPRSETAPTQPCCHRCCLCWTSWWTGGSIRTSSRSDCGFADRRISASST